MEIATAVGLTQEALLMAIQVPGPILGGVLVVGLLISIFQAITQIHEMTLVFIPKVLLTYALLYVLGNWMIFSVVNFASRMFTHIPNVLR